MLVAGALRLHRKINAFKNYENHELSLKWTAVLPKRIGLFISILIAKDPRDRS